MNKIEDLHNIIQEAIDGSENDRKSADKVLAKQQRDTLDLLAAITAGREEIEELDLIKLQNDQKKVLKKRMELEFNLAIDAVRSLIEITNTTKETELALQLRGELVESLHDLNYIKKILN